MINPARTYYVYFDWDRSDLNDRARRIVHDAAEQVQRLRVNRIEINGNTDATGAAKYNLALSLRRTESVAAELMRLGVPPAGITTQGLGSGRPLAVTRSGVREPQNRRVDIVLQ